MELTQSERARLVVRWLAQERGVNQKDIGELLGHPNNTYFSTLLSGRKPITKALMEKLAALDPRINVDFLTGVSDKMLIGEEQPNILEERPKAPQPIPTPRVGIFVPPELAQMVTDLTSIVRDQQAMIRNLIEKWCEKEGKA